MGSLVKKPKMPAPVAAPPDHAAADAERRRKEMEAAAAADMDRKRRGRASTIFTSGSGVEEEVPSARKTLAGY
jgi:hypothetical protein